MVTEAPGRVRRSRTESQGSLPTVAWLNDLVRLEIVLWERIDARLRVDHSITLGQYESLWALAGSPDGSMRVGVLAQAQRITVGGASKVADRLVDAGLIRRRPDPVDGRASVLTLTPKGRKVQAAATNSYESELADALDALTPGEQQHMHAMVRRLLSAQDVTMSDCDDITVAASGADSAIAIGE